MDVVMLRDILVGALDKGVITPKECHDALALVDRLNVLGDIATFVAQRYPNSTWEDHLRKMTEEYNELVANPCADEVADVLIVCVAMSVGMRFSLPAVARHKLEVNKARKWKQLPDGRYRHID